MPRRSRPGGGRRSRRGSSWSAEEASGGPRFEVRLARLEEELRRLTGRIEQLERGRSARRIALDRTWLVAASTAAAARRRSGRRLPPWRRGPERGSARRPRASRRLRHRARRGERTLGYVLGTIPQELPRPALGRRRRPDDRKLPPQQQYDGRRWSSLRRPATRPRPSRLQTFLETQSRTTRSRRTPPTGSPRRYYVRKDYPAAAAAFARNYRTYGKDGAKAPDNLLKLGMSLAGAWETATRPADLRRARQGVPQRAARTSSKPEPGALRRRVRLSRPGRSAAAEFAAPDRAAWRRSSSGPAGGRGLGRPRQPVPVPAGRGWAARGGGALALIVDHGLRPESAAEARQVGAWLARAGSHRVLPGPAPSPRPASRRRPRSALPPARRLVPRRRASCTCCSATIWTIRRRPWRCAGRGSGADGLAGMAAVRELAGLRLLRPLLAVPKARLRDPGGAASPGSTTRATAAPRSRAAAARRVAGSTRRPGARGQQARPQRAARRGRGRGLAGAQRAHRPAGFVTLARGGAWPRRRRDGRRALRSSS